MMTVGRNTISGQELTGFVERLEELRARKGDISEAEKLVMAEAGAKGFRPKAINHVIKLRKMKPHDREEQEAIIETYLHALGMLHETPLFRQVGLMSVDTASRDQVIEALKAFVPDNGSIVVEAGGKPVRLTRDEAGVVSVAEVVERPASPPSGAPAAPASMGRDPPPDVDADSAEALGGDAFKANTPIIRNPFPFGDPRRPRWDAGWRKASGTDGMGPGEP